VVEVAKVAAETGTDASILAARQAVARHATIQAYMKSSQTEIARALSAMRIMSGEAHMANTEMHTMVEALGGKEANMDFMRRLSELNGDPQALTEVAKRSALARTSDALFESFVGGILSGPSTQVANLIGNTATAFGLVWNGKWPWASPRWPEGEPGRFSTCAWPSRHTCPGLPKEIRRSTKTPVRSLALAKAQEMCPDFAVRYSQGAEMPQPDEQPSLPGVSFTLMVENGVVRPQYSPAASPDTLLLMTRCMQHVLMQGCGRGGRATNGAALLADPPIVAVAPSSQITVIQPSQAATGSERPAISTPAAQQKVLWLSDAVDDWQVSGGTQFSTISWKNSCEPIFRVFRELIGDVRRDRELPDGTTAFNLLDIKMLRIERKVAAPQRHDQSLEAATAGHGTSSGRPIAGHTNSGLRCR
jgi:hypothetical protein